MLHIQSNLVYYDTHSISKQRGSKWGVTTIAHVLRTCVWRIVFVPRVMKHAGCLRFFDPPCCCFGILVPRGRAPFGQHQESRPLAVSNNGSPWFMDFPSICACSESSLTNLIGSGLNLLCLQIHSKPECRWTWPEVAILGADQKERGLWERECCFGRTLDICTSNETVGKDYICTISLVWFPYLFSSLKCL